MIEASVRRRKGQMFPSGLRRKQPQLRRQCNARLVTNDDCMPSSCLANIYIYSFPSNPQHLFVSWCFLPLCWRGHPEVSAHWFTISHWMSWLMSPCLLITRHLPMDNRTCFSKKGKQHQIARLKLHTVNYQPTNPGLSIDLWQLGSFPVADLHLSVAGFAGNCQVVSPAAGAEGQTYNTVYVININIL